MTEESQESDVDADAQLMLRFKDGDLQAFEILFSRHVRPVVNFAFRFIRSREVAEELAQEIFLRVHDAARTYKPQAKFTTWLYRIATNVCLNEIRKPHFRAQHESLNSGSEDINRSSRNLPDRRKLPPDAAMERQAIAAALKRSLAELPYKQRAAFILNKYQELSYAEVAEVMGTSEKAVKSLIHRAKESLAEKLRPLLPELLNI